MKKLFVLIVSIITLVLYLCVVSSAEDVIHSGTWGELTWELNETTGELVISGEGEMEDFVDNPTGGWKAYRKSIKSLVIEEGVTSIGDGAFWGCNVLVTVKISDSVTVLGEKCFFSCFGIKTVSLGDGLIEIKDQAFYECDSLSSIDFGNSVKHIGEEVFYYCIYLKELTIPDSVETIGDRCFNHCERLKIVRMGTGIKTIGERAFSNCDLLERVYIKDIESWCSIELEDGMSSPLWKTDNLYLNDEILKNVKVPEGVTKVGHNAFSCMIESAEIPGSVKEIQNGAFSTLWLKKVIIHDGVEKIDYGAFGGCSNLDVAYIYSDIVLNSITSEYECGSLPMNAKCIVVKKDTVLTSYLLDLYKFKEDMTIDNVSYTVYSKHAHDWNTDNCNMAKECNICKITKTPTEHIYDNDCDIACNSCGASRAVLHAYDNDCDTVCNLCEAVRTVSHAYDNDCDTICNLCEAARTVSHAYDNDCDGECNICKFTRTPSAHAYDNGCDSECNICYAERTPAEHKWIASEIIKEPTKEEQGEQKYVCEICNEEKTEIIPVITGCGKGGGAMIAFVTDSIIVLVWFAFRKKN